MPDGPLRIERLVITLRPAGERWIASATVCGRVFEVQSQFAAPNRLAAEMVAAGVADCPVVIEAPQGPVRWSSLHRAVQLYAEIAFDTLAPAPVGFQPLSRWQAERRWRPHG